ncbi:MAG: alginate export family protein [Proteobacteria bacterium]|nr:alginate export family protein [Pseudomonadota bacterium]
MSLNQAIFQKQLNCLVFTAPLRKLHEDTTCKQRSAEAQFLAAALRILVFYLMLAAFLSADSAFATSIPKPLGQINQYVRINGEFLSSYESWNYFRPESAAANNTYDLWVVRSRLGVMLSSAHVDGFAQAQYSGLYGLPHDAVSSSNGPLGLGAAYFLANQSANPNAIFLKQSYVNFKLGELGLPGASVKTGRFELIEGMEYSSGVEKFDALKRRRLAERFVGGFNAIYVGRSFDGFSVVYDRPGFNMTVSGIRPTQGNLTVQGQKEISDINMLYAALTSKKDSLVPGTEGRLFYLQYDDQRDARVVDNRPLSARPLLTDEKLNIHTIGAHVLSLQQFESGSLDALLFGSYQLGNWTNQSHQAWAIGAEAGYQWHKLPLRPWLRTVYYRSSGDGDAHDGKHQTFFSAVPSGRLYAKFPFFNQMNIQDIFLEVIVSPAAKAQININLHQLSLANANDLLYGGLGAALKSGAFGYSGNSAHGHGDIGQLIDIAFTHNYSKHLTWRLYYGHAFGGNAMKSIFPGKSDANNFLIDFNLVF